MLVKMSAAMASLAFVDRVVHAILSTMVPTRAMQKPNIAHDM